MKLPHIFPALDGESASPPLTAVEPGFFFVPAKRCPSCGAMTCRAKCSCLAGNSRHESFRDSGGAGG